MSLYSVFSVSFTYDFLLLLRHSLLFNQKQEEKKTTTKSSSSAAAMQRSFPHLSASKEQSSAVTGSHGGSWPKKEGVPGGVAVRNTPSSAFFHTLPPQNRMMQGDVNAAVPPHPPLPHPSQGFVFNFFFHFFHFVFDISRCFNWLFA